MFKTNNFLVKAVGYFLVGFFLFIIVLSFGMPNLDLNCGTNPGTVAVVNSEKIHQRDFYRYRDLKFSKVKDKRMMPYILDNYIMEVLLQQKATEMGLSITDNKFKRTIKETSYFKNPKTKEYDPEFFKMILRNFRMSFEEFQKITMKDILINEFRFHISTGVAVASEDILSKYKADNSKIKIKYSFLSNSDIAKKYSSKVSVSKKEIDDEMAAQTKKIKDPKTDRERIKKEIETRKISEIKTGIVAKINKLSTEKASFSKASNVLKGESGNSSTFKIGGNVKNAKKGSVNLATLGGSDIFRKNLMKMPLRSSSPAFENSRGIFIFTPVLRNIPKKNPTKLEGEKIKNQLLYGAVNSTQRNLYRTLSEESKIIKNLKNN